MSKKFFLPDTQAETVAPPPKTETPVVATKLKLELVESENPAFLVRSVCAKPRGRKFQGKNDSVLAGYRIDRHIYDKVISQSVNATITVNALLQFAIEELEKTGRTILVTNQGE